jgi:hypothetical protein
MATTYSIQVNRTGSFEGHLKYEGTFEATYKCWWDPSDRILPGTYSGCSRTYLANKKNSKGTRREGIFIPNVPNGRGGFRVGIFVHYWPGPGNGDLKVWSDGCVLVLETDMLAMWNDIVPTDGQNVTVEVCDAAPRRSFQPDMCGVHSARLR